MKTLVGLFAKYKKWSLALLGPLGFWGLAVSAIADAAAIPLPYDLIVAGYVWEYKHYFYVCILVAAIGSAIGGLVPFFIGRGGGELFLRKRVNAERFDKLRNRFEKQEFLALMIPSVLPPPVPWKLFVFGAGVFRVKVAHYLLAVFIGRVIRNSITAILTIVYGPTIVRGATGFARHHGLLALIVLGILVGLLVYWIIKKRRKPRMQERDATKH